MASDDLQSIPLNKPKIPSSLYPWMALEYSKCPKFEISTVAPAPHLAINVSYTPRKDKKAPPAVYRLVICPGVNFVLSSIICAMAHAVPANKNAYKYVNLLPPN